MGTVPIQSADGGGPVESRLGWRGTKREVQPDGRRQAVFYQVLTRVQSLTLLDADPAPRHPRTPPRVWTRRRRARLASQSLAKGLADGSDTQRLEGQPPARQNLPSLTVTAHDSQRKRSPGPHGGTIATGSSVTSLQHCCPSTSVWVRPVQSDRKLCMKLYTAAGMIL